MPGAVGARGSKRTRTADGEPSRKRRRSSDLEEAEEDSDDGNIHASILLMEQGILESRKNYNDISRLLKLANAFESGNPACMLATVALCRVVVRLLAQGCLLLKTSHSEKEAVVVSWLKGQFAQFKSLLLRLLHDDELSMPALTLCLRLLKAEGEYLYNKEVYSFPKAFLGEVVSVVVVSGGEDMRRTYLEDFVEQYDDIRYFTFASIK